jgi:hypothetical protein
MADAKINQLSTRSGLTGTDLVLVGDPSDGTAYKATVSALATAILGTVGLTLSEESYTADGSEGTSKLVAAFAGGNIAGIFRGGILQKTVTGTPTVGQIKYETDGTITVSSDEPFADGEVFIARKISLA